MPAIEDNPQWEKFAKLVAGGKSFRDAYKQAGYQDDAHNAARLTQHPTVKARIRELQDRQAKRLDVTVDHIYKKLEGNYRMAMKLKQPAAANSAVMGQAKLLGLIVDKSEVVSYRKPLREPSDVKRMSLEDWQKKFAPKSLDPEDAA